MNPALAPMPSRIFSMKEKAFSLVGVLPVAITFVVILGGIYTGIFSAIEASAVAALLSIVTSMVYKRFNTKVLPAIFINSIKVSCMVYLIFIGAKLFTNLMFMSGLTEILTNSFLNLAVANWVRFLIILIVLTILGCFMDVMPIFMICIPLFLPVVVSMGYNAAWFGVIMIIAGELCEITPPVGLNLFILKNLSPSGTTLSTITVSALPYVIVCWAVFWILWFAPQAADWLPSLMMSR